MDLLRGFEHTSIELFSLTTEYDMPVFEHFKGVKARKFDHRRGSSDCFFVISEGDKVFIRPNYYVGLDWVCKQHRRAVCISPKINRKLIRDFEESLDTGKEDIETDRVNAELGELNYLGMFIEAMKSPLVANETEGLLFIDWESERIKIESKDEILTPFLIIQFLSLVKRIVKKGLKNSYYSVEGNLNGRIKGKILVGQNIKTNIVRNRLTRTVCKYQGYGINNLENKFLKKVLRFVQYYASQNKQLFNTSWPAVRELIEFSLPAFERVSDDIPDEELKHYKSNVFFKEYAEAIKIGGYILKRFSYAISQTNSREVATPPFWIDMPRLFELYVYHQLLKLFPNHVRYHYSTYGNELDFLITHPEHKMVVDAKYKLDYSHRNNHNDMRQVSGYARLNKVYKDLGMHTSGGLIDCLIVYPDVSNGENSIPDFKTIIEAEKYRIKAYRNIYKVGLDLPV